MDPVSSAEEVQPRVSKVEIKQLFGLYDHSIDLHAEDRLTIIHGPNGVGKTVLLKAIAAFFNGNYSGLMKIPFSQLTVWLDNGGHAIITRHLLGVRGGHARYGIEVALPTRDSLELNLPYKIELPEDAARFAASLSRNIPGLQQIGPEEFFDSRLSVHLDAEDVIWKYADHPSTPSAYRRRLSSIEPAEVRSFRKCVNVYMIETNRLYKVASDTAEFSVQAQLKDRITDYAAQLSERIQQTLAAYGRNAQRLDQTFPHRLISERSPPLGVEALKQSIKDLENTQKALAEFGLLEKLSEIPFADDDPSIEYSQRVALTLFTRDIKEKISVLLPLSNRIRIFLDSINAKLRNKKIHINKESGLVAKDMRGTLLPLDQLSSGEQHEIVLAFELIFNMPKNSLVLLDEPELSLHVTWQRMFLPELMAISNEVQFDCIIATHSPFIVGARTDLLVLLDADPDLDLPTHGKTDDPTFELGA